MPDNNCINMSLPLAVANGGIGLTSFGTNNAVLKTGSTSTGNVQVQATTGTANFVYYSDGANNTLWKAQGWKLVQSQTASNSTDLQFTTNFNYRVYQIVLSNIVPATNSVSFQVQISTNGGSTWLNSTYTSGSTINAYNSTTKTNVNSTTSFILSSNNLSNTGGSTHGLSGLYYIYNLGGSGRNQVIGTAISGSGSNLLLGGSYGSTVTANALKFFCSSGNITSGNISIYGQI
jgi:hypothetical protein